MALPATESFTGAAGVIPNPPYTQMVTTPTVNFDGSGNGVASAASSTLDVGAFDNVNTYNNDQYSQVSLPGGLASGSNYAHVHTRAAGTGASRNSYQFLTDAASGAGHSEIDKYVAGTSTAIASLTVTFAANDVMRLESKGTTQTAFKNGVSVGSIVDAALSSGAAGFGMFNSASATAQIDNWQADNLAVASATVFSGTRRAPGQKGPFDQRGFLLSPYQQYSYAASAAVAATALQRKTLSPLGTHTGGRQSQ